MKLEPPNDLFTRSGIHSNPVRMLAPMEGVTNEHFRNEVICRGGVDVVATEFVRITGERQGLSSFARHGAVPLQIQLMSPQATTLARCMDHLYASGVLKRADWIDLNVGCPSKRVNARGAGAALLQTPERLREIILAVRSVHSGVLSIKTRVGFDSDLEYSNLLSHLASFPIDFIAIHARTKCDGYKNPANWSYLREAAQALPYPVIGNGDVFSVQLAEELVSLTGVRGVMCGRGVMINPFLFRDIRDGVHQPPAEERRLELEDFFFSLLDRYQRAEELTKVRYTGTMKEFCVWFTRNPLIGSEFFQAIKRAKSLAELSLAAKMYFASSSSIELDRAGRFTEPVKTRSSLT